VGEPGTSPDQIGPNLGEPPSPDGMINGELRERTQVYLFFAPGTYRDYDEATLEQQLVGLARRLWAGRMKEYYAAVSEAFGETVTKESPPISPRDTAFHEARDELVAEGRSADGRIHIAVRGMRSWTVQIKDGTLRTLSEGELAAHVREAASALINDQLTKVRALKLRIYR
jgi:hypothetical protein